MPTGTTLRARVVRSRDEKIIQSCTSRGDVVAFAHWAGKHVPSEAESEFACRGGLDGATYAWGEEFTPAKTWMANSWQGEFPIHNTVADGHRRSAAVSGWTTSSAVTRRSV